MMYLLLVCGFAFFGLSFCFVVKLCVQMNQSVQEISLLEIFLLVYGCMWCIIQIIFPVSRYVFLHSLSLMNLVVKDFFLRGCFSMMYLLLVCGFAFFGLSFCWPHFLVSLWLYVVYNSDFSRQSLCFFVSNIFTFSALLLCARCYCYLFYVFYIVFPPVLLSS